MSKIRVAELFAGYGSQSMALERLKRDYPEFDYEVVLISEIEPNALKAYEATHGYCPNVGDISQVVWSEQPDFDLATWSFPCTDISGAGKQMGLSKDSGTRSSLCWEAIRCFKEKKPKFLLMENVSALAQRRFIRDFHALQYELEQIGYTNFCAILDSSKYGVPQHRERLFMISILDCTKSYHFPEPFKLEKRIKDILEPYGTVDESFYFSPEQLLRIIAHCDRKVDEGCGFKTQFHTEDEISGCVTTRYGQRETDPCIKERTDKIIKLGNYTPRGTHAGTLVSVDGIAPTVMGQHGTVTGVVEPALMQRLSIYADNAQAGRVYDVEGISPCLDTCSGGNRMPKILEPCILGYTRDNNGKVCDRHDKDVANTIHGSTGSGGNTDQFVKEPVAVAMRGRNPDNPSDRTKGVPTAQRLEFGDNVANCITTVQKDSMVAEPQPLSLTNLPDKTVLKDEDGRGYLWQDGSLWRVRKLTGLEVMRLMDVADEDYFKMKDAGISKTAIYSLAGNSIVVNVLYHIFRKLWIDTENESAQKSLFDF